MLLSIIIVSYNTKELLEQCLKSVTQSLAKDKLEAEIIIVDNNSTDSTQEYLGKLKTQNSKLKTTTQSSKSKTPKIQNANSKTQISSKLQISNIKTILNQENVGFARAVNQGIKKARGKYFLLLNSDIRVLPGSIKKLIEVIKKKKDAGLAAPKLLNKDGRTSQASCYYQPTISRAFQEYWLRRLGAFEKFLPRGGYPVSVEAVVGAAMLIPKNTIDLVGLFDEKFFMYYEDLDFCRRLKKADLKVYYVPRAKMIHHHGASGKKEPQKVNRYLIESSKSFHGVIKHFLITVIIKLSLVTRKSYFIVLLLSAIITAMLLTFFIIYFK